MHDKARKLRKGMAKKPVTSDNPRLPPGQVLTERFPILHEGEVPLYAPGEWSLRLSGEGAATLTLALDDLQRLPRREVCCDIHCVTRWSKFDTRWYGVHLQELFDAVGFVPPSRFVMAHADNDYQTNLRLEDLLHPQSLLALGYDGQPLTPQHGAPVRLLIAGKYFWKSAKWLRGLEFTDQEQAGFWESNGFHLHADPFAEERFSGAALDIPEDEWQRKAYD